ncbi:MAG: murein biosynthesis integral membrane protein MurJ [Acidimicrobiales bacterium]
MTAPAAGGRPSLARATGVMAAGTALSRVTGFGRNIALAVAIGQNRLSDTYNLANTTPNIIYELLLGGVLSATLVPLFVDLLARTDRGGTEAKAAWHDISAVVTLAVAASVAAAIAFALAAPLVVSLYFGDRTADQRAVGTGLVRLFALQVVAYGAIALSTALLNARRRFAAPMFAPIANNLVVIATILLLPRVARSLDLASFRHDGRAIAFLGLGTTLGVVAMAAVQVGRLPAAGVIGRRGGLRPTWDLRARSIRQVVGLSGWTLGVVVANQVALLVVLRLAAGRDGGPTAYMTALVFFLLPHGVYAVSVITALQPDMAERWTAGDRAGLGEQVGTGLRTILAVIVPAGVGLALVALPLVRTLLQHGRFDAGDTRLTAGTLACLALGLPGFSAFLFLTRVWQSMQDTRTMFLLYVGENGVNVVLALALFPRFGIPGLAAAYGAAYTLASLGTLVVLARRLPAGSLTGAAVPTARHGGPFGPFALRLVGATAALAAAVAAAMAAVGAMLDGGTRSAGQLLVAVPVGATAFLAAAAALGLREPLALVQPILRRLRRGQAT